MSTHALTIPDIDTYTGLMHTLFVLEDRYGLKIGEIDREICLRLDKSDYSTYMSMFDIFHAWQGQAAKLEQGEITREDYDQWRYKYPTSKHWAKVPSQAVSDMLMEEFQKIEKKGKNRNKHISPSSSMTDIRQMNFCASTSPFDSLSTQKGLADIQLHI